MKSEVEELLTEIEKLKEIISYIPKVPTQPYEKEMAQRIRELEAENIKLDKKLQITKDFLNQLLSYASKDEDEVFTNKYTLLAFVEELNKK